MPPDIVLLFKSSEGCSTPIPAAVCREEADVCSQEAARWDFLHP